MLLPAEKLQPIDIDKFVEWVLLQVENKPVPIGSFILLDVNDFDQFSQEHMVNAFHYERILLTRHVYETPILREARIGNHAIVVYGREAERVSDVLFQRGYKTVLLRGNLANYRESYPCLLEPELDYVKLREAFDKKRSSVFGGRLWRSTSASRLKSVSREERAVRSKKTMSAPKNTKKPWL